MGDCVICLEGKKKLERTQCNHNICIDCLMKMFEFNMALCSVCRQPLILRKIRPRKRRRLSGGDDVSYADPLWRPEAQAGLARLLIFDRPFSESRIFNCVWYDQTFFSELERFFHFSNSYAGIWISCSHSSSWLHLRIHLYFGHR